MKRNSCLILCVFSILCFSCSNTDEKIQSYIENHCDFKTSGSCFINIKYVLKVDFDTMYLFTGYPVPREVFSAVLKMPYTKDKENSDGDKIILIKNRKIVYEDEWIHNKVIISGGIEFSEITNNNVIFDGDKLPFSYVMYLNPIFNVEKINNPTGQLNTFFYSITNKNSLR